MRPQDSPIDFSKFTPEQQAQISAQFVAFFILVLVSLWVAVDARDRGWSKGFAYLWGLAVFLVCICVLPAYFVVRDRPPKTAKAGAAAQPEVKPCPYCSKQIIGDPAFCPHCSAQLKSADEIHKPKP